MGPRLDRGWFPTKILLKKRVEGRKISQSEPLFWYTHKKCCFKSTPPPPLKRKIFSPLIFLLSWLVGFFHVIIFIPPRNLNIARVKSRNRSLRFPPIAFFFFAIRKTPQIYRAKAEHAAGNGLVLYLLPSFAFARQNIVELFSLCRSFLLSIVSLCFLQTHLNFFINTSGELFVTRRTSSYVYFFFRKKKWTFTFSLSFSFSSSSSPIVPFGRYTLCHVVAAIVSPLPSRTQRAVFI